MSAASPPGEARRFRFPHLRWLMVGLVFLSSVLNYLDRQTLSILAPTIQQDLRMTDTTYANVLNAFMVAYTLSYLLSGKLTDKLGTRVAAACFVGFWSLANMLTSLARSATSLGCFRFLLGLGEAGNYTAAPKVVAEWFPRQERALAIGVYTLGGTIGATLAPPLVNWIAGGGHWQRAFWVTGSAGLFWILPWLLLYRRPAEHAALTEAERRHITAGQEEPDTSSETGHAATTEWESGWRLFAQPALWGLILTRMLTDPVWYFYQSWFAKYLHTERGLTQLQLSITWVVFLAADIGSVVGGYFSGYLIKRGRAPIFSRLAVMLTCACLMPLSPLVSFLPALNASLAVAMLMVAAHMAWLVNISTLVVDLVPKRNIATVFGVVAAGSTAGGIMMNSLVAWSVGNHGYRPAFVAMSGLHLGAWLLLAAALRLQRNRINSPGTGVPVPAQLATI